MNRIFAGFWILSLIFAGCKPQTDEKKDIAEKNFFWLGTYTDGNSKGIYRYSITNEGIVAYENLAAESENPSYLAKSADGKYLLSVNENSPEGYVSLFSIQGDTLLWLDSAKSGGEHPCHISINNNGTVLTANYSSGTLGLHKQLPSNSISELLHTQQHFGAGTHERQKSPHAHSVYFLENEWIVSADLGTNELWFFRLDSSEEKLIGADSLKLALPEGSGPRHLTFTKSSEYIYVLNELNSTITLLKRDSAAYYSIMQNFTTLPKEYEGDNLAADIHLSADERFLYSSNRGHNSIAVFERDTLNGSLRLIAHEPVRGEWPRNFALSPDNRFLIVANQHSNNLVVFIRDADNGTLTFTSETEAFAPVCILF